MRPGDTPQRDFFSIPRGMWLLGRARREGIACFSSDPQSLLAALAPTIAIALLGLYATFSFPRAQRAVEATRALAPLISALLQLVVSERYAAWIGRSSLWPRYAAASLWCAWLPVILMVLAEGLLRGVSPGLGSVTALGTALAALAQGYSLWLTWYVTRVGLAASALQAVVMTVLQTVAVAALFVLLWLLPPHYNALVDLFS